MLAVRPVTVGGVPWLCFSERLGWGFSAWCLACLVVDVVGGWVEGGLRRGVGWRACITFPETFVTHADALLAPRGRRPPGRLRRRRGLAAVVGPTPQAAPAGMVGRVAAGPACP